MIRILLADDHDLVRQGLRRLLDEVEDFRVVGEAATGHAALDLTRELTPDVLVLDLMLPGQGGFEVLRKLDHDEADTAVVMLSIHSDEAYVAEALGAGARGYVLKCADSAELVHAVREAAAGRTYLGAPISQAAVAEYSAKAAATRGDPLDSVTERELEVLRHVARGRSSTEIGYELGISPRTVESHRANLLRKLGLRGQAELIRFAFQRGLVPLHPPPADETP